MATVAIVVLAFPVASLAGASLWLGVFGIPLAIAYNRWAWNSAAVFPISPDSANASRRANWVVNMLAILGIFWS
ncbi:hypothetical protein RQP54_19540 [Curvibacter sp. APW13]|uniref:hypothetical protein n=1 Tax=Curvibacter sp. APW13 TaxID=3077236 RepID=UPI0028DF2504|nr:hypothetical protein [Curvibacter sp. APW13]MDT8993076.1 hypothetical protein [Curvibacter sp. APW13]